MVGPDICWLAENRCVSGGLEILGYTIYSIPSGDGSIGGHDGIWIERKRNRGSRVDQRSLERRYTLAQSLCDVTSEAWKCCNFVKCWWTWSELFVWLWDGGEPIVTDHFYSLGTTESGKETLLARYETLKVSTLLDEINWSWVAVI